jgi:hypothetical protein
MADHSAVSGSKMAGSRVSASAYNTAAAAEKRRAGVGAAGQDHRHPCDDEACDLASAMNAGFL